MSIAECSRERQQSTQISNRKKRAELKELTNMQEAESIGLLKKKRIRTANSPNSALTEQPTVHKQHQPALKQ